MNNMIGIQVDHGRPEDIVAKLKKQGISASIVSSDKCKVLVILPEGKTSNDVTTILMGENITIVNNPK